MRFYTDTLGLSAGEFGLLRDLIHERTGLCYEDGRSTLLSDKLSPLVVERGFSSFLDYYYLLKYDSASDEEWRRVLDALAVPETYFWREMDQVRALVDLIVPAYFAQPARGPLTIWSAACASGEEPLTIALALDQAGWFERAPITIRASDASAAAIARAQAGMYRERSFRTLPAGLRERYFERSGDVERVDTRLAAHVNWQVANLMVEAEIKSLAASNIIFCRNVFIYFSTTAIRKVVTVLARYMAPPGYLFLGASESLLRVTSGFELKEVGGAFVYAKT